MKIRDRPADSSTVRLSQSGGPVLSVARGEYPNPRERIGIMDFMLNILNNVTFKKIAFALASLAFTGVQTLPPHTIGFKVSTVVLSLGGVIGIVSNGVPVKPTEK